MVLVSKVEVQNVAEPMMNEPQQINFFRFFQSFSCNFPGNRGVKSKHEHIDKHLFYIRFWILTTFKGRSRLCKYFMYYGMSHQFKYGSPFNLTILFYEKVSIVGIPGRLVIRIFSQCGVLIDKLKLVWVWLICTWRPEIAYFCLEFEKPKNIFTQQFVNLS